MNDEILLDLLKSGKITEADLLEARKRHPTNETKRIVDLVHGVFCVAEHSADACGYYIEENDLEPWQAIEHQIWLEVTLSLMRDLEISTENEFLGCFHAAMRIKKEILSLTPQAQDLLQRLLKIP